MPPKCADLERAFRDTFTNLQELHNGTKPLVADSTAPPPANSIVIGPGESITRGQAVNDHDFTDWTVDDIISFDEFQGEGSNNQGGDVYRAWDGFDTSRDMVAFYARDGGADRAARPARAGGGPVSDRGGGRRLGAPPSSPRPSPGSSSASTSQRIHSPGWRAKRSAASGISWRSWV